MKTAGKILDVVTVIAISYLIACVINVAFCAPHIADWNIFTVFNLL